MNKTIRYFLTTVIGFFVFFVMIQVSLAKDKTSAITSLNRIVAVVNNEALTQNQLNQKISFISQQLKSSNQEVPAAEVLESQVLQQMIDEALQLQIAKTSGIRASQSEVNQALNNIARQNGQSVDALYKVVSQQGWTVNSFRQEITNQIIIQKLQEREVASRISISQQDVDDFIRNNSASGQSALEYHLATIFISLPATPSSEEVIKANSTAENIVQQLKSGADFSTLAAKYSTGESALHGGDIGWQQVAQMPRAFSTIIPAMKAGEVSDPIRVSNGFDIVKLVAKRSAAMSNKSDRQQVEQMMFQRQFNEDLQTFLSQLRGEGYVKVLL